MAAPSDEASNDTSASDPSVGEPPVGGVASASEKSGSGGAPVSRRSPSRSKGAGSSPSVTKPGPRTAVVPAPKPGTDSTPKEARWQREATPSVSATSTKAPRKGAPAKGRNGRSSATTPKVQPPAPAKESTVDDESLDTESGNGSSGADKSPVTEAAPSASKQPPPAAPKRRTVLEPSADDEPAPKASEDAAEPEDDAKPEGASASEDDSKPEDAAEPEDDAEPEGASAPEDAAEPEGASASEDDSKPDTADEAATATAVFESPADPKPDVPATTGLITAPAPAATQRVPVAAPPTARQAVAPELSEAATATDSTVVESRNRLGRRERFRARRVRRLVRHVDPWSVFKLTLVLNACMWFIFLVAGVTMWSVARSSGTIENFEKFVAQSFSLTDVSIDADLLFRVYSLVGLIITLALTGAAVIGSILFNLISDLIGGVWVSVIEEETAEPV